MDKCILIVDDEEDVVNFLEHFISRFGIAGIKATSGEEALAIYSEKKIDFVFLDINMRGLDGLAVLDKLKALNPGVKVFMITGSQDKEARKRALAAGVLDFISKPLDLSELKEKIEKYIL